MKVRYSCELGVHCHSRNRHVKLPYITSDTFLEQSLIALHPHDVGPLNVRVAVEHKRYVAKVHEMQMLTGTSNHQLMPVNEYRHVCIIRIAADVVI